MSDGLWNESELSSLVRTKNMAFVLNRLPHAEIRLVIVVAQFAERIPATFRTAVGANRRSAVRALGYSRLAAGHPKIVVSEFNLTVHCSPLHRLDHTNASQGQVLDDVHVGSLDSIDSQ